MSSTYDQVRTAIEKKQIVKGNYQKCLREMCPHVIGKSPKGEEQALFYQFGGESNSGLSNDPWKNWRCIPLENLEIVEVVSGEWHTADNHTRPQTCVAEIDLEVEH